jgi:uncharacterized membrane protein
MLLIVSAHFVGQGVFDSSHVNDLPMLNHIFLQILPSFGKPSCVVFFMITGYFQLQKNFKWQSVVKLLTQILVTSLVIGIIAVVFFQQPLTIIDILKSPQYWFANTYIAIIILSPWLNQLLLSLNQNQFLKLIITGTFLFLVFPFFRFNLGSGTIGIYLVSYMLGAYFRKYPDTIPDKWIKIIQVVVLPLPIFVALASEIVRIVFGSDRFNGKFWSEQSIADLLYGIALFTLVWRIKPFVNRGINFLASLTFGVYLVHVNRLSIPLIWHKILKVDKVALHLNFIQLLGYSIGIILLVYLASSLCDFCLRPIYQRLAALLNRFIARLLPSNRF